MLPYVLVDGVSGLMIHNLEKKINQSKENRMNPVVNAKEYNSTLGFDCRTSHAN